MRERKPVAFVFFRSGVSAHRSTRRACCWTAAAGAIHFPGAGRRYAKTRPRTERAEHVRAMLAVQEDLGYLAKDISEIDAADPDTIRIVAKVDNRALELTLGDSNYRATLSELLESLSGN